MKNPARSSSRCVSAERIGRHCQDQAPSAGWKCFVFSSLAAFKKPFLSGCPGAGSYNGTIRARIQAVGPMEYIHAQRIAGGGQVSQLRELAQLGKWARMLTLRGFSGEPLPASFQQLFVFDGRCVGMGGSFTEHRQGM